MNKKALLIFLSISHLLCAILGYCFGASKTESEQILEDSLPTKVVTDTTGDIEAVETTEQTIPTVAPTVTVETIEDPTEEMEASNPEDIPAYSPSVTTPPASQPPATQPPATEAPVTQPPTTQPPATEAPPSFDTERD